MNTKTKKSFFSLLLAGMMCVPLTMSAQVTIGSGEAPQDFSVLELESNDLRGLRLPQLTTQQRIDLQATFAGRADVEARGLKIFNTDTRCVETWNGRQWISTCGRRCGAYTVKSDTDPTIVWREFMCHNLGADTRLCPFTPHAGLHGAMFKWGTAIPAMTAHEVLTLTTPEQIDATGQTWAQRGGIVPTGDDNWNMVTANPCPPGFRVPTEIEWRGVLDNNTRQLVNTRPALFENERPYPLGFFNAGVHFGDYLFLPHAGRRSGATSGSTGNGHQLNRAANSWYWSSNAVAGGTGARGLGVFDSPAMTTIYSISRTDGFPIRCIAE